MKTIDGSSIKVILEGLKSILDDKIKIAQDMENKNKIAIDGDVNELVDFSADLLESSVLICCLCGLDSETILKAIMAYRSGSSSVDPKNAINTSLMCFAGDRKVLSNAETS